LTAATRRALQRSLPIAVSGFVLVWLLARVDLSAVRTALDARVAAIMIPSLLIFAFATLGIEALSIQRLVPRTRADFDLWSAARIKCASYLPGVIHYTLGVGGLAVLLRRRTALSLIDAVGIVLLIASTDLLIVLTTAAASAAVIGQYPAGVRTGLVVCVVVGLFGGLALLRAPGSLGPLDRVRSLSLFEGLRRLPTGRLIELLGLRALFSVCFVAGCASAFFAFEVPAPPARLIGGVMLVALVAALPIAVAGLGTSQAAFVYLFSDIAPAERLLAMSLVLSFGILAVRAAMGLAFARELTREALDEARIDGA
jgi:Lysylphosphatidylglycerol synthase TM region